jgi:FkbM family methyltransferase
LIYIKRINDFRQVEQVYKALIVYLRRQRKSMATQRKGNLIRRVLYRLLPLESYLYVLSQLFFLSFRSGALRKNTIYDYYYFLDRIIQPGDTCLDIGANLGYMSVLLARLSGKKGHVLAIEPVKPVRSVLEKNTRQYPQITILPYALGAENKSIQLGNDSLHQKGFVASGSHFVLDQPGKQVDVTFAAEMRRGSELFAGLGKIDFIKCDIEGYEIVVLPELKELINQHRPILLVETVGDNRQKLIKLFAQLSYQAYELYEGQLFLAKADHTKDILFIPEEKTSAYQAFLKT